IAWNSFSQSRQIAKIKNRIILNPSNHFKPFQTISNYFKLFQTISNHFKPFQTISNRLEPYQAILQPFHLPV
ncbi:MAG: hypothetical protein Q8905_13670, partial [Bacteroidota bacterium]|nr:hypothetical protein [Bacteroidota bacterium]